MKTFAKEEVTQVVNGIIAVIGLLMSFGIVAFTPEQIETTKMSLPYIVGGLVSLFSAVVFLANRFITRKYVTPMSNPKLNDGTPLVPISEIVK